jgi:hypothetical protein
VPRMNGKFQSRFATITKFVAVLLCACAAMPLSSVAAPAQAASSPGNALIGQVAGGDISVIGLSQVAPNGGVPSYSFASGSTIVVHSGQARVQFTGGGELDVCGPAKFTVLASGEAITIAIDFGRIHAKLDPSRPVTIYTPLITATPLAVMSQPREITFGLEPNTGAMCILAEHGAAEVKQQLSGETLIVPEPSEVALRAVPLIATPAATGSCRCEYSGSSLGSAYSTSPAAQPGVPGKATTRSQSSSTSETQPRTSATPVAEYKPAEVLRKMDQPELPPPVLPASKPRAPVPPPTLPLTNRPILKITTPPLFYEAQPLTPPAETFSVAAFLLAKEAVVEPEWTFHGYVGEPAKVSAEQVTKAANRKSKKGFWRWFHKFLFGSPEKTT